MERKKDRAVSKSTGAPERKRWKTALWLWFDQREALEGVEAGVRRGAKRNGWKPTHSAIIRTALQVALDRLDTVSRAEFADLESRLVGIPLDDCSDIFEEWLAELLTCE